jgi:hypothetical protein
LEEDRDRLLQEAEGITIELSKKRVKVLRRWKAAFVFCRIQKKRVKVLRCWKAAFVLRRIQKKESKY